MATNKIGTDRALYNNNTTCINTNNVPMHETRPRRQLHVQQQRRANRKDNELMGGT